MLKIILAAMALTAGSAFANSSTYTSVLKEDCITIQDSEQEQDPEIDYYTGVCPGINGYQVKISGGDLRYGPTLMYQGKDVPNSLYQIYQFHDMGSSKVEWRNNALIFRINTDDGSYMHVVRLAGADSCTVAVFNSGNLNQRARNVADHIESYPCLWE